MFLLLSGGEVCLSNTESGMAFGLLWPKGDGRSDAVLFWAWAFRGLSFALWEATCHGKKSNVSYSRERPWQQALETLSRRSHMKKTKDPDICMSSADTMRKDRSSQPTKPVFSASPVKVSDLWLRLCWALPAPAGCCSRHHMVQGKATPLQRAWVVDLQIGDNKMVIVVSP